MLESIICKLLHYLGDNYGLDYDDLKYSLDLTDYEIEYIKQLLEDNYECL